MDTNIAKSIGERNSDSRGQRAYLGLLALAFMFGITLHIVKAQIRITSQPASTSDTAKSSPPQLAGIKVGMDIKEVEKLAGAHIIAKDDFTAVPVKINGIDCKIVLHTRTDGSKYVDLVYTYSNKFKTDRGIGIGSTLMEAWDAYKREDKSLLRSKGLFAYKDEIIASQAAYVLGTYGPLTVDDGYYSEYSFYLDGKTERVIAIGLYHSEDNW